uniref:Ovule protein n=1 Tax=Mesocestoides corti TaxID=53468 RepID=A0A5K3FW54_MESCO
ELTRFKEGVVNCADSHSPIRFLQLPTQGPHFHSMSPAARILNSPLIGTNIYPKLSSHLGLDFGSSLTHT